MKLRSLLLAAMLAASSASVLAEDLVQNVSMSTVGPGSYSTDFGGVHNYAGTFTDTFTFNPAVGPSLSNGFIKTLSLGTANNLDFTSASLNGHALTLYGPNYGELSSPVSVSGTLTLIVTGNTITPSASYAGTINVAAVPEPATYGMLLAGMGIVGFLARRRHTS